MRVFIGAAVAAALTACLVPQAALGLAKPPATFHPDVAPVEAHSSTGGQGQEAIDLGGTASGSNAIAFTSLTTAYDMMLE